MYNKKYTKYVLKNMHGKGRFGDLPSDILNVIEEHLPVEIKNEHIYNASKDIYNGEKNNLTWREIGLNSEALKYLSVFYDVSTKENFIDSLTKEQNRFIFEQNDEDEEYVNDTDFVNYILDPSKLYPNLSIVKFSSFNVPYERLIFHENIKELIIIAEYLYSEIDIILPTLPLSIEKLIIYDINYFKDSNLIINDISNLVNLKILRMDIYNASIESDFPPNIEELWTPFKDIKRIDPDNEIRKKEYQSISFDPILYDRFRNDYYPYDYDLEQVFFEKCFNMESKIVKLTKIKKLYIPANSRLQFRIFYYSYSSQFYPGIDTLRTIFSSNMGLSELYIIKRGDMRDDYYSHGLESINVILDFTFPSLKKLHLFKIGHNMVFDTYLRKTFIPRITDKITNLEELCLHALKDTSDPSDILNISNLYNLDRLHVDILNPNDNLPKFIKSLSIKDNFRDDFEFFSNLKFLTIVNSSIKIKKIPKSLEYIYAKNNIIEEIKSSIHNVNIEIVRDIDIINTIRKNIIYNFDFKDSNFVKVTFK
jgi:hypothetical protein